MQEFAVVVPNRAVLSAKGFAHASDLPIIFKDGGTKYDPESNEFLYERCLGYWPPSPDGQSPPMTPRSQRTYCYALADFLTYASKRGIDLAKADYVMHIYGRYQPEMLAGTWSTSGRALAASTVNGRVERACEYLAWLAFKGRRKHFVVPTREVHMTAHSHRSSRSDVHTVRARKGRVPARRREMQLPTDESLGLWLGDVERTHGPAISLAFELILQTAIRKAELIGWRVDTIPKDPNQWIVVNPTARPEDRNVSVSIRFGTKGGNYGSDSTDKTGPEREILVPLTLARRLHAFREEARRRSMMKLKNHYKGAELAERMSDPHLFLDERSGEPINYDRVTNCWRNVEAMPFKGWSPHRGRHWWACMTLWRALKMREAELRALREGAGQGFIAMATDIIRLEIKTQLGHVDEATTYRYIRWVARQLSVALPTTYANYMQTDDELPEHEDVVDPKPTMNRTNAAE